VIVSLSPIAFYLLMSLIMPGYREFYRTFLGQVILLAVVLLSAGGYYLQNKLGTMGMDIEQVMK
jgi:Flp pilus assembly protein TadB